MQYFEYSPEAFAITDFLSGEECAALISRGELLGFDAAPITQGDTFAVVSEVRNNTRVIFEDINLAEDLWGRCSRHVPSEIDGWVAFAINERFRLYRYEQYQSFKAHSDARYARSKTEESKLTFMVYLNDDFEGGHTGFRDFNVYPGKGMALCFRHPLTHEGAPVSLGRKYVLRSDVMYRYAI